METGAEHEGAVENVNREQHFENIQGWEDQICLVRIVIGEIIGVEEELQQSLDEGHEAKKSE